MMRVRAATVPVAVFAMVVGTVTPPAAAQETPTFTLTGQIVDAVNERPVIAAVVKVPELRRFVFADVNGRFHFADFPEGTWEIVVEQLGYHTLDGSVTVAEGNGLHLRLNPDPIALEGLRVRTRSERLLTRRRQRFPYRVTTISTRTITDAINPDPASIFRWNARSPIVSCSFGSDEWMSPGCVLHRGRPRRIAVLLDEVALLGGMVELSMFPKENLHSMDWIPCTAQLRVYTKDFIERMDQTRISVSPWLAFC